jgi:4a-hydroxytetrahydrobiopterin dehydratase
MTPNEWTAEALATMHCRVGAARLSAADLERARSALPGWSTEGQQLTKSFSFPDYYRSIAFVNALAWTANREDHHPDLGVHYNRVEVAWSTHDAGGITLNDCICAARTDQLVA